MRKYLYLYSEIGKLTHINDAIKGEYYYYFDNKEIPYIVREGDINIKHFSLKSGSDVGGEGIDHYNAKMKIVYDRKYYDTIFKSEIFFDEVIPEKRQGSKIPDLSCFIDGKLVMAIEIHDTNPKTEEDIEQLKELNIPIIEINIKNGNKTSHLVLPTLLEVNRGRYKKLRKSIRKQKGVSDEDIQREIEKRTSDNRRQGLNIQGRVIVIRGKVQKQRKDIEGFAEKYRPEYYGLNEQRRINERRIFAERTEIERLGKLREEYSERAKRRIKRESINFEIERIEREFVKIAQDCKIEWFRNKWMTNPTPDKISEIKYWTND